MTKFSIAALPDLTGKVAIVTGANSGLGIETTKALAAKGARVIMACRNEAKANAAASAIRDQVPNASLTIRKLDLGDLASVNAFSDAIKNEESKIDFLINNAGLFSGELAQTKDGHELQFGTNHLGHFVMNACLLPLVEAAHGRIIGLGSASHEMVKKYSADDLNWEARNYNALQAYAQSKLANMLFIDELARRLETKGSAAMAVMAHPGFSSTGIMSSGDAAKVGKFQQAVTKLAMSLVAQSQEQGAWPTLLAATDPAAEPGDYYGPTGRRGMRGEPGKVNAAPLARDQESAAALWKASETLTGVSFAV